jgi:hypothetical protein
MEEENHFTLQALSTAVKQAPMIPVAMTILDIQIRGLSLLMTRFDGKSKRT